MGDGYWAGFMTGLLITVLPLFIFSLCKSAGEADEGSSTHMEQRAWRAMLAEWKKAKKEGKNGEGSSKVRGHHRW